MTRPFPWRTPRSVRRAALVLGLATLAGAAQAPAAAAAARRLDLAYQPLELPAAPSAIVATDVDGDGRRDLVLVLAYTAWGETSFSEEISMDDVQGLVEVLTVIPELVDRRELHVYLGRDAGGFHPTPLVLPLDATVLSVEAGPSGMPVIALTDQGLDALRLADAAGAPELVWEPLVRQRPLLAGTGSFLPDLGLVHDLDGDGDGDVLLPTRDGVAVWMSDGATLTAAPAPVVFPLDDLQRRPASARVRLHPLPEVHDVDGDGLPELILRPPSDSLRGFRVYPNLGGGRFGAPLAPLGPFDTPETEENAAADDATNPASVEEPRPVWFGDLDGDGRAEYLTEEEVPIADDASVRQELANARRPRSILRLHRAGPNLAMDPAAYARFEVEGYVFAEGDSSDNFRLPGGLRDLDGDGRLDVVAMTLDFSMLQAVKILTVQRLGIGLDFHLWCQSPDGRFRPARGGDLSGKFTLDLRNPKPGQLSQFAGDFDGDGRQEFVQMGRGRDVTIHRGGPGCRYEERPNLALKLREEPRDLGLTQVRDLDGDGLADLLLIQPQARRGGAQDESTPPVRLDLYLSGGAR